MPACQHDQTVPNLEDELEIAAQALAEHDPDHAAHHLCAALALAPADARVLALFHRWCAFIGPASEPYLDLSGKPSLGQVLLAARLLALRGDIAVAVGRTLNCLQFGAPPDVVFWLVDWTRDPQAAGQLKLDKLAYWLKVLALETERPDHAELVQALDDWLDRLDTHVQWEGAAWVMRVRLKRIARRLEAALALARRREQEAPSYHTAAAIAACHRDLGDRAASVLASRLAATRAPEDGFVWLDIGDQEVELERFGDACRSYAKALSLGAKPDWARCAQAYCQYRLAPSADTRAVMETVYREAKQIGEWLWRLRCRADGWVRSIPWPGEACLQMLGQIQPGDHCQFGLSAPEAACALYACRRQVEAAGGSLDIEMGAVHPDPRAGDPTLAAFDLADDGVARPRFAEAGTAVASELAARLAVQAFDPLSWLEGARMLRNAHAQPLTPSDLIAAIPYPQPSPEEWDPVYWFRCHVAACVYLVAAGPHAEGALWTMVDGPIDWPGETALVALAALAVGDAAALARFRERFARLRERLPEHGHYAWLTAAEGLELWFAEQAAPLPGPRWWAAPPD